MSYSSSGCLNCATPGVYCPCGPGDLQINKFKAVVEKSANLHDWQGQIRWLNEVLTMSARMAALTGNTSDFVPGSEALRLNCGHS